MRQSRMTNKELEDKAREYRMCADEGAAMAWPENSEEYREKNIKTAEVFEELLDWRMRAT